MKDSITADFSKLRVPPNQFQYDIDTESYQFYNVHVPDYYSKFKFNGVKVNFGFSNFKEVETMIFDYNQYGYRDRLIDRSYNIIKN